MSYDNLLIECINRNYGKIIHIINNNPPKNIHYDNEKLFKEICISGNLDIAKLLLKT